MKLMNNKKGQGAMEYLMTYGWAILVVLVIGVALWYMGIFSIGPSGLNRAVGFSKLKVPDPTIQYSSASQTLKFVLVNGAGSAIENLRISITGGDHLCGNTTGATAKTLLLEGETVEVIFNSTIPTQRCTKSKGATYLANIQINYTTSVMGTTYSRQDGGSVSGTVE